MSVKAWREPVVTPTYEAGAPEKTPIFPEKRVYQGTSGVVYPFPDSMADEKVGKTYQAVYIENEYIKVMVLPELVGLIQMSYDKVKAARYAKLARSLDCNHQGIMSLDLED